MGSGASAPSATEAAEAIEKASAEELKACVAGLDINARQKVVAALKVEMLFTCSADFSETTGKVKERLQYKGLRPTRRPNKGTI